MMSFLSSSSVLYSTSDTTVLYVISYNALCYGMLSVYHYVNFVSAGGRLNKKDGLTRYDDSHVKDKTS